MSRSSTSEQGLSVQSIEKKYVQYRLKIKNRREEPRGKRMVQWEVLVLEAVTALPVSELLISMVPVKSELASLIG